MFSNKKPKTIKNTLISIAIPKNYKKSTVKMAAELSAFEDFDGKFSPAAFIVRLISCDEMNAMQGDLMLEKYLCWVNPAENINILKNTDVRLANFKGVSLIFDRKKIDHPQDVAILGEGQKIESLHICLNINAAFHLDIICHYDGRRRDHMQTVINEVIDSFKLNATATLDTYQQLTAAESAEAAAIIKALDANDTEVIESWTDEEQPPVDVSVQQLTEEKHLKDETQAMFDRLTNDHQSVIDTSNIIFDSTDGECCFEYKVTIDGLFSNFEIHLDKNISVETIYTEADFLLTHIKELDQRSKEAVVDEFLDIYNSSWTDESIGIYKIDAEQFLAELTEAFISIDSYDSSFSYGTKSDLFHGLSLSVEYKLGACFKKPQPSLIG